MFTATQHISINTSQRLQKRQTYQNCSLKWSLKQNALYSYRKSPQSPVPRTAGESKLWKDVNLAEQIGLKMAKSKWLEAQHALKRNSLRKDNPHIRILTHFTHSCVCVFFFSFTHSHSKTTIAWHTHESIRSINTALPAPFRLQPWHMQLLIPEVETLCIYCNNFDSMLVI